MALLTFLFLANVAAQSELTIARQSSNYVISIFIIYWIFWNLEVDHSFISNIVLEYIFS